MEKWLNRILLFFAFLNVGVVFLMEMRSKPKVIQVENTVTTNHVIIVTNFLSSSDHLITDQETLSPSSHVTDVEYPISYQYCLASGEPCAVFYGRYYVKGSPTSYGRIKRVYPDRILLDNGSYLKNQIEPIEQTVASLRVNRLTRIADKDLDMEIKSRLNPTNIFVPYLPDPFIYD